MNNKKFIITIIVAVILIAAAYWVALRVGFDAGYAKAQNDAQQLNEEAGAKATQEAAKAANPFQAVNPLEGVEANPFEKAKKVLNPFE